MAATLEADLDTIAPPGNPDDFVVLEDRPLWAEHWTREGRDELGNVETESVFMGEPELNQVAENCNERIRETGDFAPFVINHTKDDGSNDPEVIGFVGPYYVSRFGKDKPKAAIFARKIWVFKEDYHKLKKYPRLSVEYWSSKSDPTNGILDPISALGATTPELDLGIRYGRGTDGMQIMRYSREVSRYEATASPGGSNTYVAGLTDCDEDDERHLKYQANEGTMGNGGPMSAEALSQFVEAMKPVITAIVEEQILAMKEPPADVVDPDAVPTEAPDPMGLDADPMGADPLGGDLEAELPPDFGEGEEEGIPAELSGDIDPDGDDDLDEGNDDDTDPIEDAAAPDLDDEDEQPERYSAEHPADAASESLDQPQHLLEGAMSLTEDAKRTVQKYQKERDDSVQKYQKEVAAHRDTKAQYEKLKTEVDGYKLKEMRATRYAKLAELSANGYVFDIDEEIKDVMGEGENAGQAMTDPQFARHTERIAQKYSRIPNGTLPQDKPEKVKLEKSTDPKVREKYAKQAITNVNVAKKRGETTTFEAELKKLKDAADNGQAAA